MEKDLQERWKTNYYSLAGYANWKRWLKNARKPLEQWKELPWWKRQLSSRPEACDCINSVVSQSWASQAHDIVFHVCDKHSAEYNIPMGPYWIDEVYWLNRQED